MRLARSRASSRAAAFARRSRPATAAPPSSTWCARRSRILLAAADERQRPRVERAGVGDREVGDLELPGPGERLAVERGDRHLVEREVVEVAALAAADRDLGAVRRDQGDHEVAAEWMRDVER